MKTCVGCKHAEWRRTKADKLRLRLLRAGGEMTDRELLELAAKAAGVELDYTIRPDGMAFYHSGRNAFALANGGWFAPLTDDGDALRLAVKLRMSVKNTEIRASVIAERAWVVTTEPHGADPLAATRRAIVRAAAEIGKGMRPFPTAEEIREEWT